MKTSRATLLLRIDRVAGQLNPILVTIVIGLTLLNITLYLGLSASQGAIQWTPPRHIANGTAPSAPAAISPVGDSAGRPVGR